MSRLRFTLYFIALSACATLAFASCFVDQTSVDKISADKAEFAVYLASPIPKGAFLPKSEPPRSALRAAQVALAN